MLAPLFALSIMAVPVDGMAKKKKKKSKAQKAYKKGVNAAKESNYEEAISHFEEARARGAPPVTLFNIGKCYEAMGKFYVAVDYYNEYLTYPKAKKVKKIKKRIEELKIKPSVVTFDSIPQGAEVHKEHDDLTTKKIGVTPLEITVEAGEHVYYVIKQDYKKKRVKIDAGFGLPFPLEITMTPRDDLPAPPPPVPPEPEKEEYTPVGLQLEAGGGASLHPWKHVDFKVGADTGIGIGWRFMHGAATGFAIGLRANFRPYTLTGQLLDRVAGTEEDTEFGTLFTTLLAVPAFQVKLHERLGLEFTLPLGIMWMTPTEKFEKEDFRADLFGGYLTGPNLVFFDLGIGASLRIILVRGLYLNIEPARLHLIFPIQDWENNTKALIDIDMGVRLGYEF